jgi:citrate/tricarballylate utilization protein
MLCFAATCVAAFYDNVLGWKAPYPFLSLPVVLGSAGGIGLLVGPPGLFWLKTVRNPELDRLDQVRMDVVFTVMLFLTSLTGFMLLAFRESSTMGLLLGLHLGFVLGLFVTMPYGKFVHGVYRFGALVRNAVEEGRVGQVRLEGREGL